MLVGEVFWTGEDRVMVDKWNSYNVLILPDFTNDGVPELLLAHGGDLTFPPEVCSVLAYIYITRG